MRILLVVALAGCKCSGSTRQHDHEPVDPQLTIAVVVPSNASNVDAGQVFFRRRKPGFDGPAWQREILDPDRSTTFEPPRPLDDGWVTSFVINGKFLHTWYRSLGPLGIQCMYFDPKDEHIARAGCFGTQLVHDGIWVPFALEPELTTTVRVAIEGEPMATSVSIEPGQTTEAKAMRGLVAQNRKVDSGTLADGWWILTHEERNNRYTATVQRTLAGQDLVCSIYDYGDEALVRRGMTTCLMLEPIDGAAAPIAPPPPPADAAPAR